MRSLRFFPCRALELFALGAWLLAAQEEEDAEPGNGLCWYNSDRTYERCCEGDGDQECWKGIWVTAELCCHPLTKRYQQCFDDMEARVEQKLVQLRELGMTAQEHGLEAELEAADRHMRAYEILLSQPMSLWSWACAAPASPLLWSEGCECCEPLEDSCDQSDPRLSARVNPEHLTCCYPVYARKSQGVLDEALEGSIQAQLAKLRPSRWAIREHGPRLLWRNNPMAQGCVVSIQEDGSVTMCPEAHACPDFDCSYLRAVSLALEIIQLTSPLPAMELVMSAGDETVDNTLREAPVFTRVGTRWTSTLALPAEWQLHPSQCVKHVKIGMLAMEQTSWEERKPVLIWRGSHSNLWSPHCKMGPAAQDVTMLEKCVSLPPGDIREPIWNFSTWLQMPRGRLVTLTRFFPFIDARFVDSKVIPMAPDLEAFLRDEGLFAERMSSENQATYKYQIAIEGNSAADRICWQLFMGSVVIVPDGPWQVLSVVSLMEPWVHYVPVLYDLSDLVERLEWLRDHDAEAKAIAQNGATFAHRYLTCDSNIYYVDRLLRAYAERLTD